MKMNKKNIQKKQKTITYPSAPNTFSGLDTLPETNIAPKNGWLEYYFPIGMAYFQVLC